MICPEPAAMAFPHHTVIVFHLRRSNMKRVDSRKMKRAYSQKMKNARTVEESQKMKRADSGRKPANLNVVIPKINHLNVAIIYCYSNFLI
jgi:hypothetical protein